MARMKEREFSQGRMSRETGLSYNTVKKYLRQLEASTDFRDSSTDEARKA